MVTTQKKNNMRNFFFKWNYRLYTFNLLKYLPDRITSVGQERFNASLEPHCENFQSLREAQDKLRNLKNDGCEIASVVKTPSQ